VLCWVALKCNTAAVLLRARNQSKSRVRNGAKNPQIGNGAAATTRAGVLPLAWQRVNANSTPFD